MALATRPKPKVHHKKRQAKHHRRSKHYLRSYWPYLPMLAIVGIGLFINSAWSRPNVLGVNSDYSITSLLNATNTERTNKQEASLTLDSQLTAAAQAKAEDMVKNNYWAHNSPDGKTPWSFITSAGYNYQLAGENLAYGFDSATASVVGWMNSPSHRANILNAGYQNVGFGVAHAENYRGQGPETIVVAEYGTPAPAVATITFNVPQTAANAPPAVKGINQELAAQPVSRVQILTGGQAAWSLAAVVAVTAAALAVFLVRHGFRLQRAVSRSEYFLVHHPWLDILMVLIIMAGFILTRVGGIIR